MQYAGKGKVLRIYLNKYMQQEKELLYEVIVKKAHAMGVAGAMVFQGVEGFGFCCPGCRTLNLGVAASVCQPLIAEFIDKEEKIKELHSFARQLMKKGGIVVFDADLDFDSF
jgi:PII-like signaling protein